MEAALERIASIRSQFDDLMEFAYKNYERGQLVAALKKLNNAIKLSPDSGVAWNNLGITLASVGHNEDAIECFDKALSLGSLDNIVWYNRGKAYRNSLKFEESFSDFDHVVTLDPKDGKAWFGRGQALMLLRRYDEALFSLDHADKFIPKDSAITTLRCVSLVFFDRLDDALLSLNDLLMLSNVDTQLVALIIKALISKLIGSILDTRVRKIMLNLANTL